jgi:putative molybdopterin biosynthesis protein
MKQSQFLEVLDRDEAERRWRAVVGSAPLGVEEVALADALGRVLAGDVRAEVDGPGYDRSNMDGFAVRAEDSFGAAEEQPVRLRLLAETIPTGVVPNGEVTHGTAMQIATGGMLPRGADAVVPVEVTDVEGETLVVRRAVVPGAAVSFAGTDMGAGETVLFAGTRLGSRETGVLAAIGCADVRVVRRPIVAILSTGDEIVQPGEPMRPGLVYDSNGRVLADAVSELGGEPWFLGAVRDDERELRTALARALAEADLVLLSGGTSKGEGDLNTRVVAELTPGSVVHGVALKPGKPICLAAHDGKPVVILPGFPTSAIFTFHEFVAPVLRALGGAVAAARAGGESERHDTVAARLALRTSSERGRLEYLLVGLVRRDDGGLAAYPMGKGSGSVTAFSRADGFVRVPRNVELLEADAEVAVTLLGRALAVADLVVLGSHCTGLDRAASALARVGFAVKVQAVGSQGGLAAARRGECDVAPIHLLDAASGRYNEPFLGDGLRLLRGWTRMQGVVTRPDDPRSIDALLADPAVRMVNRNRGAGTRVLIDELLAAHAADPQQPLRPPGFAYEPRSHYAVAAAVAQRRADWGVAIAPVAREQGLRFQPLREELYDFAVPASRWERPAVHALRTLLEPGSTLRGELEALGFGTPEEESG